MHMICRNYDIELSKAFFAAILYLFLDIHANFYSDRTFNGRDRKDGVGVGGQIHPQLKHALK